MLTIKLSEKQIQTLFEPINGRGGFQNLIKTLQNKVHGNQITLNSKDIKRIQEYANKYGYGGYETRLKNIFKGHINGF
jgi:hypothetical protein